MKKFYILILATFFVVGCQKENLTVKENQRAASFLQDGQLKLLVQSVAAHDSSYDDLIDAASCFSINFPYTILLNGEEHNIASINDLLAIGDGDEVEPLFPVSITFADYTEADIPNFDALLALKLQCDEGELYNERITCVDIVYPISIAIYNTNSADFETVIFDHDKVTFQSITDFQEGVLASINYPLELQLLDIGLLRISSNEELKTAILEYGDLCL